jgi:ribosomal protein S18 acetylase RimI-like enzyme
VARPEDDAFLRDLFLDARPELAVLRAGGTAAAVLVDQQVTAQRSQYLANHPEAIDHVVLLDAVPVGRCWTATGPAGIRLLDLAVLQTQRGRGIATAVLGRLCRSADLTAVPVELSVWGRNEGARRLYERFGFTVTADHGGYVSMRRAAAGSR